jgi:putative ABC transport system permease protein
VKFLPLLIANVFRKKLRTGFTIGSFAVAFFLFGLLAVVRGAFNRSGEVAGVERLIVVSKVSLIQPLPYSYKDRLEHVTGVKKVTFASWFGGVYQDEHNSFPQYAIDTATYREVFPEFQIPSDQWAAFLADRQGCIVGADTAKRFHWKVGDRVPLRGTVYSGAWEFNVRGIYQARPEDNLTQFWLHYDYLDERATIRKGQVSWYIVRVANSDATAGVAKAIDDLFANSPFETRTETEKTFMTSWLKQMGNIEFLIVALGGVVFFTLLLVSGNTMTMALEERVRELAVLKAIGFSNLSVIFLLLGESLVIATSGGTIGLALAELFSLRGDPTHLLGTFYLPPAALAIGALLALAMGVISAAMPARAAAELSIVEGLRRI